MAGVRTYKNDFNKFYTRFDCHDFEKERNDRVCLLSEII